MEKKRGHLENKFVLECLSWVKPQHLPLGGSYETVSIEVYLYIKTI
jgi:hypothetical protein